MYGALLDLHKTDEASYKKLHKELEKIEVNGWDLNTLFNRGHVGFSDRLPQPVERYIWILSQSQLAGVRQLLSSNEIYFETNVGGYDLCDHKIEGTEDTVLWNKIIEDRFSGFASERLYYVHTPTGVIGLAVEAKRKSGRGSRYQTRFSSCINCVERRIEDEKKKTKERLAEELEIETADLIAYPYHVEMLMNFSEEETGKWIPLGRKLKLIGGRRK
jgi:hypothetical protein